MEKKLIIFATLIMAILTPLFVYFIYTNPDLHEKALAYYENESRQGQPISFNLNNGDLLKDSKGVKHDLRLILPEGQSMEDMTVNPAYIKKRLLLSLEGINSAYFNNFPLIGEADGISNMVYYNDDGEGIIDIEFTDYKDYDYTVEGSYVYFDFFSPRERYDHIVVLDPGHGGSDVGANELGIFEKKINLNITLYAKEILEKNNIKVYLTRAQDDTVSLDERINFANSIWADCFVSVHQNSFVEGQMSDVTGTEVMYCQEKEDVESQVLAKSLLTAVCRGLKSQDRGLVKGDGIFVLNQAVVPASLVEVGFMTNMEELMSLNSEEYQRKAAESIADGILESGLL